MSELPGIAAVGIESVEWAAETGGNLTLRVTGRWRRRRPALTGQPILVIEAEGRRHRFPALPEPPSLAGTGPGVWRLSFTVPGWLAPDLGRTWLQFGTMIVPLPVAVPAPGEQLSTWSRSESVEARRGPEPGAGGPSPPGEAGPAPGPAPMSEPPAARVGPSGRNEGSERGSELASRVAGLERELGQARADRDRLAESLADRERGRRLAEQRAHAEQALRQDIARRLSEASREAERARQAMGDLAAAEERIRAMEEELRRARRRSDEAEQLAAAASAARERAEQERADQERRRAEDERRLAEAERRPAASKLSRAESEASPVEAERVRFEHRLSGRPPGPPARIASEPVAAALRPFAAIPDPVPPPVPEPPPMPEPPPIREPPPLPAPGPVREPPPPPAPPPLPEPPAPPPMPEPPPPPAPPALLEPPTPVAMSDAPLDGTLLSQLRQELSARARAEAALRARLVNAESRLAARVLLEQRTSALLRQLRGELDGLRDALGRERAVRVHAEGQAGELERERALRAEAEQRVRALEAEQALRINAERRLQELTRELEEQRILSRAAYEAIDELRHVLEGLAAPDPDPEREPEVEALVPDEVGGAQVEVEPEDEGEPEPGDEAEAEPEGEVEAEPEGEVEAGPEGEREPQAEVATEPESGPAQPGPSEPPAAGASALGGPSPLEPARFNDALTRLRETTAPAPATVASSTVNPGASLSEVLDRPSLERSFRKLVKADPEAAGRLLMELLPLQRVMYPHPVTYDLVLEKGPGSTRRCVCVTVPNGTTSIAVQTAPRPRREVDFQVFGEPARIARLLTAGRFRRRFGRRVARVRGRREGLAALSALLGTPLDLQNLHRAGVRLDAWTAFSLVAGMIDPAWTVHERFTLAHTEPEAAPTYLIVREGARPHVARAAPEGTATTTVACPAAELLAVLSGIPIQGLVVEGDERTLVLLRQWIKRAQRG